MTADAGRAARAAGAGLGWYRSASGRLRRIQPVTVALAGLIAAAVVVHGFRVVGTPWLGGDLLYHGALSHSILRGELPPGGPYEGLPSWYPPGFHLLLAATMSATGLDFVRADQLLTLLWLPVLPVGTFLLARRVTGRPWVALLAVAFTLFAGALDLRAGRLWVNSLFVGGQAAYPLYPRDLVFGLLPFAVLATLEALRPGRSTVRVAAWAAAAGALFGLAGLVQVQLLLPLPLAILVTAAVVGVRDPGRRRAAVVTVLVAGAVAALVVAPWLLSQLDAIRRNGGVALDSSETLEPARFGFWSYPRQFGLLLPLGLGGAGVALAWLRGTGAGVPAQAPAQAAAPALEPWRPRPAEAGLLLVAWWAIPFVLGILYRPDWPLEDALRPQRLWLLASQPLAILAAVGAVLAAEVVVGRRWRRPRWVAPAIVGIALAASLPATTATVRLLAGTWTRPTYAHLDLATDRVPDLRSLLGDRGAPRRTVLTHEDWSSLAWYATGHRVVALVPAGFAKLAYDPAVFTGRSQEERRADLASAFAGDPAALAAVADRYGASTIVVARREGSWALVDLPAALAATAGRDARVVEGNGWDGSELQPEARLQVPVPVGGPIRLEIRLVATPQTPAGTDRAIGLRFEGRAVAALTAAATRDNYQVVVAELDLPRAGLLEIVPDAAVTIQSVRGFVAPPPAVPGWRVASETPEAIVLERATSP